MRKIILLWLILHAFAFSQTKNIISTNTVFPKVDKVLEFEKALAAHAQKYHSGDSKWRVYEITTGPDANGYLLVEGPTSWETLDTRGNLGTEHNNDWNKSVAPFLTDRGGAAYLAFQDSLSTVQLTDYSDKVSITRFYPKIGWGPKVRDMITKMRKAWMAGDESVAVYQSSSSGPNQFAIVTRYKQGLKERAMGFRKPFLERYEAANGSGSWADYMDVLKNYMDNAYGEMLIYRPDLSSK